MNSCPVCNNNEFIVKRSTASVVIGECSFCGLGYTDPLGRNGINGDDVPLQDDEMDAHHQDLIRIFDIQSQAAEKKAPLLLNYWTKIYGKRPEKILEIGCGAGAYYKAMNKLDVSWKGIEISDHIVDFAQKKGIPVEKIDILSSRISDQYDVVFLSQVLEHIYKPLNFVKRIRNILPDCGILHLDVPNHDSLTATYRKYLLPSKKYGFLEPYFHCIAYNKKSLEYLLSHAGFRIFEVKSYSNDHPVMGQLNDKWSIMHTAVMRLSDIFNRGSLLTGIAVK